MAGSEVLRKMIARPGPSLGPDLSVWLAVLGRAIGKVAEEKFDVAATFEAEAPETVELATFLEAQPDLSLFYPLSTSQGRHGLVRVDPLLVNAVIEVLTGASPHAVLKTRRRPTPTDAALCRGFVTDLVAEVVRTGPMPLPDWVLAESAVEARPLQFRLEGGTWGVLGGAVSFQGGVRGGAFAFALPLDLWRGQTAGRGDGDAAWTAGLKRAVDAAPLVLRAVLERIDMPLGQALRLAPGDDIPISAASLSAIGLEGIGGRVLATGRLGQAGRKKAVRVSGGAILAGRGVMPEAPVAPRELPGPGPGGVPHDGGGQGG
jgi:flagellar motor switch protein FliM